jgi:hypothetical protein
LAYSVITCRIAGQQQFGDIETWINDNIGIGWDFEFIGLEDREAPEDTDIGMVIKLRFYKRLDALTFLKSYAIPQGIPVIKNSVGQSG